MQAFKFIDQNELVIQLSLIFINNLSKFITFILKLRKTLLMSICKPNISSLFHQISEQTDLPNNKINLFQKNSKNDYSYFEDDLLIEPNDKKQFELLHFPQKSLDFSINPLEQSISESFVVSSDQFFKRELFKQEDKFTYEYAKKQFGNKCSRFQLNLEEGLREQREKKEERIQKIRKNIEKVYRIDNENKQFYVPCTIEVSEDQEEDTHETTEPVSYFRQNKFLKAEFKDRQSQQMLEMKKRKAEQLKSMQKKRLIEFSMMSPRIFSY